MITEDQLEEVRYCPWCKETDRNYIYTGKNQKEVYRCKKCSLVYAGARLNQAGIKIYWDHYESQVHLNDQALSEKRELMYRIDYSFISRFMETRRYKVLDVGCASGQFLSHFEKDGHDCYGVELGEEAALKASEKYRIWCGELDKLDIAEKFDLIVFRGTIQYLLNPRACFEKAAALLNPGGMIFITSSPNSEALCFRLFGENFTQPVDVTDYYAFSEQLLTGFFRQHGCEILCEHSFYKETPYADPENDIIKVAKALSYTREGKKIDFKAPAFFDNMLTLLYKKVK